jgi:hypothetical protein
MACERQVEVLGRRRRRLAEVSPVFARFRDRGHGLGRGQVQRGAGGTANLSRWPGRWLRRPWRRAPQGGGAAKGGVRDAGATARFARVKRGYEVSHLDMMLRSHKRAMEKRRWRRSKRWRRPGFMGGRLLWRWERVWEAQVSEKGSCRGSRVCFYRARRGGGATTEVMAINGYGGPTGLDCIQGRGLNEEETEGVMGGG